MESLHSVGGAITFIALFQQIYTIVIESILSWSMYICQKIHNQGTINSTVRKQAKKNENHLTETTIATICAYFKWSGIRISDSIGNSDHLQTDLFLTI